MAVQDRAGYVALKRTGLTVAKYSDTARMRHLDTVQLDTLYEGSGSGRQLGQHHWRQLPFLPSRFGDQVLPFKLP
jgi:hypothetical protein